MHVNLFKALIPSNVPRTSGWNQSSRESQISGVLCPRLESLQIEDIWIPEESELLPILKSIVTLRAIFGSPLKSFTFYASESWDKVGADWEGWGFSYRNGCSSSELST
jgi:hypothetical protein